MGGDLFNLTAAQGERPQGHKGKESNEIAFLTHIHYTSIFLYHNLPTQTKPHPLLSAANLLMPANAIANTQPPLTSHKPHGIWAKEALYPPFPQSLTRKTAEPTRAKKVDKVTLDHTIRIRKIQVQRRIQVQRNWDPLILVLCYLSLFQGMR